MITIGKIAVTALFLVVSTALVAQGSIKVTVNEIESDEGNILVNLYASGDGFPNDYEKALQKKQVKAQEGSVFVLFEDIPFGTYAVSVAQDKNENGEIDTNLIGFPKEPVGASNQTSFGRPTFKKSQFTVSGDRSSVDLAVVFVN